MKEEKFIKAEKIEGTIFADAYKTKPTECPICHKVYPDLMGHGSNVGRGPKTGDPAVCIGCAQILVIGDDGIMLEPTIEQMMAFYRSPRIAKSIDKMQEWIRSLPDAARRDMTELEEDKQKE